MSSFIGRMLVVDLTSATIKIRAISQKWARLYTGQKGLGTRILMEDFDPTIDPFSPDNRIVLTASVMAETVVSCSAKLAITTKSPQTGTITDGSIGGHVGAELKYAGYDAVCITGAAKELTVLVISPDGVELKSAQELKGLGTFETEDRVKNLVEDQQAKILANGPAGENRVLYSCISTERYRQLGRGGIGAVMGSKNLKAISIRGWLDVSVPDMAECLRVAREIHAEDKVTDPENEIYTDGTPILVDFSQKSGLLPTANFQEGTYDEFEGINSSAMKEIRQAKKACFSCAIACGNYLKGSGVEVEGPEYETIALCGSNIKNASRDKVVEINAICDDLGLDTISVGAVLSYMMEMTEKSLHDFGIRFGETDKAINTIRQIAFKEGIGAEAAMGTQKLSEKYGGQDFAIHVKGLELPGYDPRGSWAMGIAYASAPRGGCHMSAYPIEAEAWGDLDPFTYDGKAQLVADLQNAQFAKFSMGVCDFWPVSSATLARLYEVTFGGDWSSEEVETIGERIFNLQRVFNIMAGFDRKDDQLPQRFHKELLKAGPPKDRAMPAEAMNHALDQYFLLRGWDSQGRPTPDKLRELAIEEEFIKPYQEYLKTQLVDNQ